MKAHYIARRNGQVFGRVNVKLLVILVIVAAVLIGGAVAVRQVRRTILADRDRREGLAEMRQEDWTGARRHFQEYLGRRPKDGEIHRRLGEVLLRQRPMTIQHLVQASASLREAMNLGQDDEDLHRRLADIYTYIRNFNELAYLANRCLERRPNDPEARLWLGRSLAGQRKAEQAREVLIPLATEQAASTRPGSRPATAPATIPAGRGTRLAVQACLLLASVESESPGAEHRAAAMAWLDRAVAHDPRSAEALVHRARLRRTMGPATEGSSREDLALGAADLERAEACPIEDPRPLLVLCEEWMILGRLDRAERALAEAGRVDPKHLARYVLDGDDWTIGSFLLGGELKLRQQRPHEAAGLADSALQAVTERNKRIALLPLAARIYVADGKIAPARKCLDEYLDLVKLLQSGSGHPQDLAFLQALVASAEDRPEEAARQLEPLADRNDLSPPGWRLLARAYVATGQDRRAAGALREYLKLQPSDGMGWLQLARQLAGARDPAPAMEAARKAETLLKGDPMPRLTRIELAMAGAAARPGAGAALDVLGVELAELAAAQPKLAPVRVLQARLTLLQGRPKDAEKTLRQAVADLPDDLSVRLQLVGVLAGTGQTDQAEPICQDACKTFPRQAGAWLALARLHQQAGRRPAATQALQQGIQAVGEGAPRSQLARQLAVLEMSAGDRKAGLERLGDLARQDPRDLAVRSLLLDQPEQAGDREKAERLLEEIRVQQGSRSLLWRWHRARLWFADDQWRKGRDEIQKTLEKWMAEENEWSFPALALARMYQALGEGLQAEQVCRRALARNPGAVELAELLVDILQKQDRQAEAAKVVEALGGEAREVADLRVRTALASGDTDQAVDLLKKIVQETPSAVGARVLLAQLIYRQGRNVDQALACLDDTRQAAPPSLLVTATRVNLLHAAGRDEQALTLLNEQVERAASPAPRLLRGRFHLAGGRWAQAEQDFRQAAASDPRSGSLLTLVAFLVDRGRLDDAVAELDKSLQAHADDPQVRRRLVETLAARKAPGDLARAEKVLDELEACEGKQNDLLWARASLLLENRTPESARKAGEILQAYVERDPGAVGAQLALADLCLAQSQPTRAGSVLDRALQASPGNFQLLLAKARIEAGQKRYPAAADLIRSVLDRDADNAPARDLLVSLALTSHEKSLAAQAQNALTRHAAANPADAPAALGLARFLAASGQAPQARSQLEAFVATPAGKDHQALLLTLAEICRRQPDLAAAEKWLLRAAARGDSPEVFREHVALLAARRDFGRIIELVDKNRKEKPPGADRLMLAASALAASGEAEHRKQARAIAEEVLARPKAGPASQAWAADLSVETGDPARAEQLYRQILAQDGNNAQALNGLAWVLTTSKGQHEEALKLADRSVALAPDNYHARDTRGVVLLALGRLKEARADFQTNVDAAPEATASRAKALRKLGIVCAKLGERAKAREFLTQALTLDKTLAAFPAAQRQEAEGALAGLE